MALKGVLSLFILHFSQACGTVEIEGEERVLACPRDVVQYTCHVGSNSCVSWNLYCPGRDTPFSPTAEESCNGSEQFSCSSNGVFTMFNVEVTYSNSELNSGPHSNITIQMLNSSIPESGLMNMRIDCEDSRQYRYLSFEAIPPVPENLSYSFENPCNSTHLPTVFSWTPVTSVSQDNIVTYVLDIASTDEDYSTTVETNASTVTVYLEYWRMYDVDLYASTCQSELTSEPVSLINITTGNYTSISNSSYPGLELFDITPSSFSFKCPEGKDAVKTVCSEDGRWDPDPSSYMCKSSAGSSSEGTQGQKPHGQELKIIIGIASGVVFLLLVSLAVGTVIIVQRLHLKFAGKISVTESPRALDQDTVMYEEVQRSQRFANHNIHQNGSAQSQVPQRPTVMVGEYCVLNGNGTTSPLNPQLPSTNAFLSQSYAVPAELVRESDPTSAPPPGSPQHNTSHIPIGNDPMYAVPSKPRFQKHRQNTPSSTVGTSSNEALSEEDTGRPSSPDQQDIVTHIDTFYAIPSELDTHIQSSPTPTQQHPESNGHTTVANGTVYATVGELPISRSCNHSLSSIPGHRDWHTSNATDTTVLSEL